MASVLRHVKFQDDSRKPLFPVSTNLPTKMRPPQVNIPACRPSATTAPPRENELEPVQERLAAFICKWRGCTAILASSSILRGHVRTCHCLQSFREVTSSSTRKRSRYSCQYDNCRQQGYISSDELLTHIVTDHFLDIKLPALQDGISREASWSLDAYMRPLKRRLVSDSSQIAQPSELPTLPELAPSWKLTMPIIRPSRSKKLTREFMISRLPPKSDIPVTWMSWTDTPDKLETELTPRDIPFIKSFNPHELLNFTIATPPPDLGGASSSLSLIPFAIGFRKPLDKTRMTVLNGDKAQGYRPKPVDPNAISAPTIGFEHSLSLKAHLAKVESRQAIKDSRLRPRARKLR